LSGRKPCKIYGTGGTDPFSLSLLLYKYYYINKINNLASHDPRQILFHKFHKPLFATEHSEHAEQPLPPNIKKSHSALDLEHLIGYNSNCWGDTFPSATLFCVSRTGEPFFNNLVRGIYFATVAVGVGLHFPFHDGVKCYLVSSCV
jgi:hypothetical protein